MVCWRKVVTVAFLASISIAGAMKPVSLDCTSNRKSCALLDVRTNADYQIEFPPKFNRNLAQQVTSVEIKRSNFAYFPGNLFEVMPKLESITARGCGLVALNAYTFGAYSPYNVVGVKNLRLERNQLANLEPYTFSKAEELFELRLARNRLSSIDPLAFYGLGRLDVLDMSHNQLTHLDLAVFATLPSLRTIHLRENKFQVFNFDVFRDNVRLNYVNLADNGMTTLQATAVNNVARHIDLRSNQLVDISALGWLKGMDILQLSDNKNVALGPTTFAEMAQLNHLRLDGVDLQRRQNNDYRFLAPLRQLRVLYIGQNGLTAIAPLPGLSKLHTLIVNKNELSSLDANALKAQHPKLMQININNNRWDCQTLTNVVGQLKNSRIKLNFNSGEGQGRPAVSGTNVEGVGCDGDASISYPIVEGDPADYDIDER
jgi:Leucine-rich repeat (LRR) protein